MGNRATTPTPSQLKKSTGAGKVGTLDGLSVEASLRKKVGSVNTFSDLAALSPVAGDTVKTKGFAVVGKGGRTFVAVSGAYTPDGATISATANGLFFVSTNLKVVSFEMFGATDNPAVDSTAACQAAINYAIASGITLDITGNYGATELRLNGANGLHITGRGSIVGLAAVSTPSLLTMKNVLGISSDVAWFINCNYNTNYDAAIWAYTDAAGQQAAYLDFTNISPVNAKQAWKFGNDLRPDDLVSEINVRGGNTYGCPSVVLAVGAQTVVNFTGSTLASLTGGGNAGWQALPQKTVVARGATVNITGGELLHVLLSTGGSSTTYNTLCEVQPIASVASGNIWGNILVSGAIVESACRLASSLNAGALVAPSAGLISFVGNHGVHTQDSFPFVETDASFLGKLKFKANNFFCTVARTQLNISCGGLCEVDCDDLSFGNGFKSVLSGIVGGILRFSYRMVLNASNLNGQAIANGSSTTLKFIAPVSSGDLARFTSCYDSSTGVFTVPAGGLKNVRIESQLCKLGLSGEWYVQVNGTSYGVRNLGQYNANSYGIQGLSAGDTIKIVTLNTGGALTANSSVVDWFQIFASN